MKKKISIILGTRPEAIKLIPVYLELKKSEFINPILISTGQHKEMLNQIFNFFEVRPDVDLNVMTENQSLASLTSRLFAEVSQCLEELSPEGIIVQGDTTTSMVSSMVGFYLKKKVIHVEAGLRTYNKYSPFPEEINRRVIGLVSDIHFPPTKLASEVLKKEGCINVYEVGNTGIDSLLLTRDKIKSREEHYMRYFPFLKESIKNILITGHRRESFGEGFTNICNAIKCLAVKYPEANFVYPVHLNPNVKEIVYKELGEVKNIILLSPLPYDQLIFLMSKSYLILTDSGGIQEEAPSLNVPLLVMRENTERPEGIDAGCAVLTGTDADSIIASFERIYNDSITYSKMSEVENPYGDGKSSYRIRKVLEESFQ